jgi:hypothetical protein
MADLSVVDRADFVKLVGSDPIGGETTPIKSSLNGDIATSDIADNSGVDGSLSVGTTALAARVGGANLANRKLLIIQAIGGVIYWGFSASVTTATGKRIEKGATTFLPFGPNTTVYLIAAGAGNDTRIGEAA